MKKRYVVLLAMGWLSCTSSRDLGHRGGGGDGGDSEGSSETDSPDNHNGTGDAGGDSASAGSGAPPSGAKRVFVTSTMYTGNLKSHGGGINGLDGGDKLCQLAADTAQLGGEWVAWLSSNSVNAIDKLVDVGPWYRLDGAMVFSEKSSIPYGAPLVAIDVDETGADSPITNPWTGTGHSGQGGLNLTTCGGWTQGTQDYTGTIGATVGADGWTDGGSQYCGVPVPLYCFEQ